METPTPTPSASPSGPDALLRLARCTIRPLRAADVPTLAREADDPRVAYHMRDAFPHPYTRASAEAWLRIAEAARAPVALAAAPEEEGVKGKGEGEREGEAEAEAEGPLLNYAICLPSSEGSEADTLIGGIGLKPLSDVDRRTAELGYWLGPAHWGRGLASEAAAGFARWAFATLPGLLRLEACVYAPNVASTRVLERAGFAREGVRRRAAWKHGQAMDVVVYGLLREECLPEEGVVEKGAS